MRLGLSLDELDSRRQTAIIHTLTRVGTLLYVGWVLWLFQIVYRVTQVAESQAAGLWEQRLETLSFIGFLPNLPAFALPAVAASIATWMAGPAQELGLAILLRIIRWTSNGLVVASALGVVVAIFGQSGGIDEVGTIAFRSGGVLGAAAISVLCLEAGRTAPGG